jgi:hypothetical protein
VPQSYYFCIKNALKLTYEHLYFKKNFRLAIARHEGKEKKEGEGRGGEGKGRGGKGQGAIAPKFGTLSMSLLVDQILVLDTKSLC